MARFSNGFQPRTELGNSLSGLMTAMFSQKLAAADGQTASKRSAAQDERDRAEALKAGAEADEIRRREGGVGNFLPNFASSLVPQTEVPNVMGYLKSGQWEQREDPNLHGPLRPDDGPLTRATAPTGWDDKKALELNDAVRANAFLQAAKPTELKDLNLAVSGPGQQRLLAETIAKAMGLPSGQPAATVPPARADVPAVPGLPSGPGMARSGAMPTQPMDMEPIVQPLAADIAGVPPLPGGAMVPPAPQPPEQVMPEVTSEASPMAPPIDNRALLRAAAAVAPIDNQVSANLTGVVNASRQLDEQDLKNADAKNPRGSLGTDGLEYDKKTNQFFIGGSKTPATTEELAAWQERNKRPLVNVDTYDKTGGAERAKLSIELQKSAMDALKTAESAKAAAEILAGYGGGWTAEVQAQLGRILPGSDWGKIASAADAAEMIRNSVSPYLRAPGSGATSDMEFSAFMNAFPGLSRTPEGRKLISAIFDRVADRIATESDIYQELAEKGPVKLSELRALKRQRLPENLLSKEEMAYVKGLQKGPGPVHQSTVETSQGAMSREAVEAEARRRGMQ